MSNSNALDAATQQSVVEQRDRALVRAIFSGAVGRLVALIFGVISVSITARELGQVRYGVVATLGAIVGVAGFADLGVGNGLLTRLAAARARGDDSDVRALISSALATVAAVGLIVSTLGALSALFVPWRRMLGAGELSQDTIRAAVVTFALSLGLGIAASVGQRVLMAQQEGLPANVWTTVAGAAALASVAVAAALDLSLWAFIGASIGAPSAVYAVQSYWVLWRRQPHLAPALSLVSRTAVRSLAGFSGLFLVLNLAIAVAYETDAVVVAAIRGAAAAAEFAIALRMFSLVTGLIAASTQQMWPAMSEALARGDLAWVRARFGQILLGTVVVATGLCLSLILGGRWLARVWVGQALVPSRGLLVAFAAWTVYSLAMSLSSYVLHAAAIIRAQVVMALTMAATNLGLSILLTMRFGLVGPLLGSLIAHVLCAGVPTAVLVFRVLSNTRDRTTCE